MSSDQQPELDLNPTPSPSPKGGENAPAAREGSGAPAAGDGSEREGSAPEAGTSEPQPFPLRGGSAVPTGRAGEGSQGSLLAAEKVVKRFGDTIALGGVSFDVRAGEVHAICGENGAGKSTLIKVLSGIHPAGSFEGELRLDGAPLTLRSTHDAAAVGISVIYQELALAPEMTVAENVFLGREPTTLLGLIDWPAMNSATAELLRRVGIRIDPQTPVSALGIGSQQLVEIAKALSRRSRVLILDEPTAALSETETQILLDIVRTVRDQGVACVYISHKLDEVLQIADRITVLRDGRSIVTVGAAQTDKNQLIRHMVGREIAELYPARRQNAEGVVLAVDGLNVAPPPGVVRGLRGITFRVRAGEVLGIGGLMGAGRTELLMHLFGAWGRRNTGSVTLGGVTITDCTPDEAIAAGMVLVSEDRKRYGLVLGESVAFNLSLSSLADVTAYGLLDSEREWDAGRKTFEELDVRASGLDAVVGRLSGGNQQKIVLGKALMTRPKVMLLDEPTRGIDIGAKQEVYALINRLSEQGMAVVLVSSELPELMGMSDRILILHEGKLSGEFRASESTPEMLMAAAMGQPTPDPSLKGGEFGTEPNQP